MSPSPALEIMLMPKKLGKQRVQLADAHQCMENVRTCDETKRLARVWSAVYKHKPAQYLLISFSCYKDNATSTLHGPQVQADDAQNTFVQSCLIMHMHNHF